MPDQLVWFENAVSVHGYQFVPGSEGPRTVWFDARGQRQHVADDDWILTPTADEGEAEYESRSPLETTGLFRNFAALDLSDDAILEFAKQFGSLTNGTVEIDDPADGPDATELVGEPRTMWLTEIRKMSELITLWDAMRAGNAAAIDNMLECADFGIRFRDPQSPFSSYKQLVCSIDFKTIPNLTAEYGKSLRRSANLLAPRKRARAVLATLVNIEVAAGTTAQLGLSSPRHKELEMRMVSVDLRGAIWLQFARAIAGNKQYQQCEECRRWFEVASPEGARADARFCSTACRAREWRRRKKGETQDGE